MREREQQNDHEERERERANFDSLHKKFPFSRIPGACFGLLAVVAVVAISNIVNTSSTVVVVYFNTYNHNHCSNQPSIFLAARLKILRRPTLKH